MSQIESTNHVGQAIPDRLITEKEVAKLFGVTTRCIIRWMNEGKIPRPAIQRHRYTRWSENKVQACIAEICRNEKLEAAS